MMPPVFWDYAPVTPTIIALLISVIAVWVAHLQNKWLKVSLLLLAIVAGLGGAWATIAGQHHTIEVAQREERNAKLERQNAEQRLATLGQLIAEGDSLRLGSETVDAPINADGVNAWITKTEEFLSKEVRAGFVSRFGDYAGQTPPTPPQL